MGPRSEGKGRGGEENVQRGRSQGRRQEQGEWRAVLRGVGKMQEGKEGAMEGIFTFHVFLKNSRLFRIRERSREELLSTLTHYYQIS